MIRCQTCDAVFRNINDRRKHAINQTVCSNPDLIWQRERGRTTQDYQRGRQGYKQWLSDRKEATILNATYYNGDMLWLTETI